MSQTAKFGTPARGGRHSNITPRSLTRSGKSKYKEIASPVAEYIHNRSPNVSSPHHYVRNLQGSSSSVKFNVHDTNTFSADRILNKSKSKQRSKKLSRKSLPFSKTSPTLNDIHNKENSPLQPKTLPSVSGSALKKTVGSYIPTPSKSCTRCETCSAGGTPRNIEYQSSSSKITRHQNKHDGNNVNFENDRETKSQNTPRVGTQFDGTPRSGKSKYSDVASPVGHYIRGTSSTVYSPHHYVRNLQHGVSVKFNADTGRILIKEPQNEKMEKRKSLAGFSQACSISSDNSEIGAQVKVNTPSTQHGIGLKNVPSYIPSPLTSCSGARPSSEAAASTQNSNEHWTESCDFQLYCSIV
uniref:Uncharacterized protein n=1 Tax=Aplanochytrium stocchinoi TaxID=215587 RepID=A0A7S3PKX0_9STRA|mmetsp:Transcript_15997/g.18987  ORF Transcript_15997/g.18987 Transcript_15997/m.18987 type:complete len:355 (-) Transcript_15997:780-1844(-)